MFNRITQVPNIIFDHYLPRLTEAELKVLLIIIRQTYGWIDKRTGKRKAKDRISQRQFMGKTALSRRVVSKAIKSLISKGLIKVTNYKGQSLHKAEDRKGRAFMLYSIHPMHKMTLTCAQSTTGPVHNCVHNKTNYTKETNTKQRGGGVRHIGEIIEMAGGE